MVFSNEENVAGTDHYPILSPLFRQLPNMHLMGMRNEPKPYDGRVVLFRRSLRAISKYLDWKLGWGSVITGEFNVIESEGGHSDMFNEP
jgi:hypothetical protein